MAYPRLSFTDHHPRDFDRHVALLAVGIAPGLIARKAFQARRRVQARLVTWYENHLDEADDVSALIRGRAALHREFGYTDAELGVSEYAMPWAAITNTPQAILWLFTSIFSRPELVERLRPEVEAITAVTGRTATVDVTKVDKTCPVLMACYRESLRLYNDNLGVRKVVKDTVLQDADGREYLLKEGTAVQWPAGVVHSDEAIWGEDAAEFNPDRWIQATPQEEKRRRQAHIPFGGGKHLCPGRNFALVEQLGLVSALILGFTLEGVRVPRVVPTPMVSSTRPSSWDGIDSAVKVRRRIGWEDVTWDFAC